MEKVKSIIPSKSFFRGFVVCLIFTQFVSVKVNVDVTDNYTQVKDLIQIVQGGIAIDEEAISLDDTKLVSVDDWTRCAEGECDNSN